MADRLTDFQFIQGEYGKAVEYSDENAVVLAIRNILLSKPGNFPFNPSIGMDIRKYQFDILDDTTLSTINSELKDQIARYIPDIGDVKCIVRKVEGENGSGYLCISVGVNINGNDTTANFILNDTDGDMKIYNEIY